MKRGQPKARRETPRRCLACARWFRAEGRYQRLCGACRSTATEFARGAMGGGAA
jgi:hypothetical protein